MDVELLKVSPRMPRLKAKKLRREGYLPGVISDNGNTIPVIFNQKNVDNVIRHIGENAILKISFDGKSQLVKIMQVQRDPITREIIHMDLHRVNMDQKIQARIPLIFGGKKVIERDGYILQHQKDTIEVEGYANDIPAHIIVNVAEFKSGQNIRVQDLEIAEELSVIDEVNGILASIILPKKEFDDASGTNEDKKIVEISTNVENKENKENYAKGEISEVDSEIE